MASGNNTAESIIKSKETDDIATEDMAGKELELCHPTERSKTDADTANSPQSALFPLGRLPYELRRKVWTWAAEQAAHAVSRRFPEYVRYWNIRMHRPPYIQYHMQSIPGDVLPAVRELFLPLFQASKESCEIASKYISKVYQRKAAPVLSLKRHDTFILWARSMDLMIFTSEISSERMISLSRYTWAPRFPEILQGRYEEQIQDIASMMNVFVTAAVFRQDEFNLARQYLLLSFRSLQTLYLDITSLEDLSIEDRTPPHYTYFPGPLLVLGEVCNREFKLKYEDIRSFSDAYRKKLPKRRWDIDSTEDGELPGCINTDWRTYETWRSKYMDDFLCSLDKFRKRGIECLLVCQCRWNKNHCASFG